MMASTATRTDLTGEAMAEIFERLRNGVTSDEDLDTLEAAMGSYLQVLELIRSKGISMRELRRLVGYRASEKLKDLVNGADAPASSSSEHPGGGDPEPPGDEDLASSEGIGSGQTDTADDPAADDTHTDAPADSGGRKGHGRLGANAYAGAERVDVPHESLCAGAPCPLCPKGKVYPIKTPRQLIRIVGQEPFKAWLYALAQLRCNLCGEVFTARAPPGVGEEKYDASAASMLALFKYGMGLPMYRLEKLQASMAIPLPDATQWDILADAARSVAPAFDELIRQAAQAEVVYNDDTFVRILTLLKENKTRDPKKERTGIFTTGIMATSEDRRISLFLSGRKHAGENLRDVLRQRAAELGPPIQMCDALDRNLPGELATILGNCLSHGRRQFVDNLHAFPEECRHVLEALGEVYRIDELAREENLTAEQRLELHQRESAPIMEALRAWMQAKLDDHDVEPNSGLGRAIRYMLKRWSRLTLFLRQAGAPIDSNIVERSLKSAILHRKNALFYRTEKGARVGDIFMSLIYTCQANEVDPRRYLKALLERPEELAAAPADWMPWNHHLALADG